MTDNNTQPAEQITDEEAEKIAANNANLAAAVAAVEAEVERLRNLQQ
jgi:hypothetical protein